MSNETNPGSSPPKNPVGSVFMSRGRPLAAGGKTFGPATWILIAAGVLWLGINGISLALVEKDVGRIVQDKINEIEAQGSQPNLQTVPQYRASLRRRFYLVIGGSAALGAALIFFGIMARIFPLPCTVSGLTLCVAATAARYLVAYRYTQPEMTAGSWFWKILTILALIAAVHSAFASPEVKKSPKKRAVFIPK